MNNSVCSLFLKPIHGEAAQERESFDLIKGKGVEGDCFCDGGARQVSLLLKSTADLLKDMNGSDFPCVKRFTCNIIIAADEKISLGSVLKIGCSAVIITQAGRECHKVCSHFEGGVCPLVSGCFFGEITDGGRIFRGDRVEIC